MSVVRVGRGPVKRIRLDKTDRKIVVRAAISVGSGGAVTSVDGLTGTVDLTGSYDPLGAAATAVGAHVGDTDPHGDRVYADSLFAANDAMVFKGSVDCSAGPDYPEADAGHVYRVSVAGRIGGASGPRVEVDDRFICITDSTPSGDHATVGANWSIGQANIDGAVIGPAGATADTVALFDGTSGRLLKEGPTLGGSALLDADIDGTLAANSDLLIPTQKAVKTYVDANAGGLAAPLFGDGSDGDVTISSNTTLTRTMFYRNLTVNSGITLTVSGYGIWVSGTLTLNGTISGAGGDAGVGIGYQAGMGGGAYFRPMSNGGGTGAVGIGGGTNGGNIAGGSARAGGAGGAGGNGSTNNGGAGGVATAGDNALFRMGMMSAFSANQNNGSRIGGGTGGGAGGWDSVNHAGGGGGGGDFAVVSCRAVAGSGTITAAGGRGASMPGNTGGGGGGGGGVLIFRCAASSHSLTLTAAGGAGGAGSGTGTAGANGGIGTKIELLGA